jgi:hypothetical protein
MVLWAVALLVLSSAKHTVSKAIIRLIFQRVGPPTKSGGVSKFSNFKSQISNLKSQISNFSFKNDLAYFLPLPFCRST